MTARKRKSSRPRQQTGSAGYFAVTLPGLGKLLHREITARPGLDPVGEVGYDGRADVVFFDVQRGAQLDLGSLKLAEDVFVTVGEARSGPPRRVAASAITRTGLERGLSTWTRLGRRLHTAMTFRTIARVVNEERFLRTELRDAVTNEIAANRPRWRLGDPAAVEIWVLEHQQARFAAGLRLSDKRMRQHGEGRTAERQGALRPVVAAAMVQLAGTPPGRLLDPYCGSGTIVGEALADGWDAQGSDIDSSAIQIARTNTSHAVIRQADGHNLPHPDAAFDAVVANLPFGRQFHVDDPKRWLRAALNEASRVTRPGGHVVVLVPPPTPKTLPGLALTESHPLRLLGVSTHIWVYHRTDITPSASGRTARHEPVTARS